MPHIFVKHFHKQMLYRRHGGLRALVTLIIVLAAQPAWAGGGWVAEPGEGNIRMGFNWKSQPEAQRRDTEGELYKSLFNMTHDYRFLYLSGETGIIKGLEGSYLFTYLWAAEMVDSMSEDPSRHYHGWSDMWVGLKYQLWGGEYPTAVYGSVRLPVLYEASSKRNGQLLTEIPGLMERDWDLSVLVSRSFNSGMYATTTLGFRIREGAGSHQLLSSAEVGGMLGFTNDIVFVKAGLEGVFSVSESRPTTSKDRFSGLSLERDHHFFNFNQASYIRPQLGLAVKVLPQVDIGVGYSYIVWGYSTVVYQDVLVQAGYSF